MGSFYPYPYPYSYTNGELVDTDSAPEPPAGDQGRSPLWRQRYSGRLRRRRARTAFCHPRRRVAFDCRT